MPNRLREIRKSQRLALWDVAVKAGCSTTTLVAVEKHGHLPTPEVRRRIAEALGVTERDIWPELDDEETRLAATV